MKTNLLLHFNNNKDNFSKSQNKIANYIVDNFYQASVLTAREIGQKVNVSESTVVRFATSLGYNGFPDFQMALKEANLDNLSQEDKFEVSASKVIDDSFLSSMKIDQDLILRTMQSNTTDVFDNVVNLISNSKHIYIYCSEKTYHVGYILNYYLSSISINSSLLNDAVYELAKNKISNMKKDDLLFCIDFPKYNHNLVELLKLTKQNSKNSVFITDIISNLTKEYSDNIIISKIDSMSYHDTMVAPLSIINAILSCVIKKNKGL